MAAAKNTPPSAIADLLELRDPDLGVMASSGPAFSHALFGRDTLEAAEDLIASHPQLCLDVIRALAALQGMVEAPPGPDSNEEEPGKIHHEFRSLEMREGRPAQYVTKKLKRESGKWGGDEKSVVYYGSADATPLYARVIARFCEQHGPGLLAKRYTDKEGSTHTIATSLRRALLWVCGKVENSDIGLLEHRRRNPQGLENQTWKDSPTAFLHLDGTIPDWEQPLAPIELQGLAYDALLAGIDWLHADVDSALRRRCARLARALRRRTFDLYWMEGPHYFAAAIDRDAEGNPRQVQTLVSNPGLLLDGRIFDSISPPRRRLYVGSMVEHLFSADFLTDAGIRCRALRHLELLQYHDYHGSCAVWPKETFDIAKGLRRQGFARLAEELEERLLQTVNRAGGHFEFFYVSPRGDVAYRSQPRKRSQPQKRVVPGTNIPQPRQAWTVSAALAIKEHRGALRPAKRRPVWVAQMEDAILKRIPRLGREMHLELQGKPQPIGIDRNAGRALERRELRERKPWRDGR